MIGVAELKQKALRHWETGAFLKAWCRKESLFPLSIALGRPAGRDLMERFARVQAWIAALRRQEKAEDGLGYRIAFAAVDHRQLGPQQIPQRACFDTRDDWLHFIGQRDAFQRFVKLAAQTRQRLPVLDGFLAEHPLKALAHEADWDRLLTVCEWFLAHPRCQRYIRQLEIATVDTKFIETRRAILAELLDRVLPAGAVDPTVSGAARHGFERRFGLRYDQPFIRLRLLDERLAVAGLTDLGVPLSDLAGRDFSAATVVVTENKINGLAFPPLSGALVIFGLGYGLEALAELPWLKEKTIWYWGDIDTHGFAILSRMRGTFPRTRSLLMDAETLVSHRGLWVQEPPARRFTGCLEHLTAQEAALFEELKADRYGPGVRLEQERIGFGWLRRRLDASAG